jgi:hypothetical protein
VTLFDGALGLSKKKSKVTESSNGGTWMKRGISASEDSVLENLISFSYVKLFSKNIF